SPEKKYFSPANREWGRPRQPSARPPFPASSTAFAFNTGSAPGIPRHTGQTLVFGGAPNPVGHPQKIFVAVANWACTSSPITASYFSVISFIVGPCLLF